MQSWALPGPHITPFTSPKACAIGHPLSPLRGWRVRRTRDGANARLVRPALTPFEYFSAGRFQVEELVLFQSIGGPGGHEHMPLMLAEPGQTFA